MTTQTQKQSPHHLVVSLNVTGGFLAGAQLEFADGLNCLIGGRGAGKTTALEFLRFGVRDFTMPYCIGVHNCDTRPGVVKET